MSDYYTLITALPWLPELSQCRQLPLSRIALERRLSMLTDSDAEQLAVVEQLYHPAEQTLLQMTDPDLVRQWQNQLAGLTSPVLRQRVIYQMELRTLLAALRSRAAGLENPQQFHGVGRWLPRIRKHWFEPDFSLQQLCPELEQIQRLLEKDEPLRLQRYLDQCLWQDLARTEHQFTFQFEALACFVLRWGIAERSLAYNSRQALESFNRSTAQLLRGCGLEKQLIQGVGQ
ncbi:DUF2764 family protein [Neptuniibacter halophilus]|uniref:DUF2764 family protein n=1 Tax=Neptuniibacter halophilus TaxID=651666 RepID=UPI002572C7F6|nr:DUF2764 family protein [Neptuniibacter halophilus]